MSQTIKKVCHCHNCGNESEMIITCSLPEEMETEEKESVSEKKGAEETKTKKVKGTAVCSHCGNEADMWIDM